MLRLAIHLGILAAGVALATVMLYTTLIAIVEGGVVEVRVMSILGKWEAILDVVGISIVLFGNSYLLIKYYKSASKRG